MGAPPTPAALRRRRRPQVPRVSDRLPQLVEPAPLLLALQLAREAGNPYFRLVFNSLASRIFSQP